MTDNEKEGGEVSDDVMPLLLFVRTVLSVAIVAINRNASVQRPPYVLHNITVLPLDSTPLRRWMMSLL
jgi:hypothetical protein